MIFIKLAMTYFIFSDLTFNENIKPEVVQKVFDKINDVDQMKDATFKSLGPQEKRKLIFPYFAVHCKTEYSNVSNCEIKAIFTYSKYKNGHK